MRPLTTLAMLAAFGLNPVFAPTALAFDPLGIVERSLRHGAPVELQRVVRSLSQASAAILPAGVLVPDAGNGQAVVYTRPGCGYCVRAIRHLDAKGVPYIEKNIQSDRLADAEFKRIGGQGVPVMVAAGQVVHGFSPDHYDRAIARMPASADPVAAPQPLVRAGAMPTGASGGYAAGERLSASHGPLRLLGAPQAGGVALGTLARGTPVTYVGPARNGYVYVRAGRMEGWAEAALLAPAP